jgi:hypothetical protein
MKGLGQRVGHAVHAHLPLFHGLEQRRLGLGRGPVQLVGQQDVREDRTGVEDRRHALAVEDHGPDQIRGQEVGGELHPAAVQPEGLGQRLGQGGLAHPGQVLNQEVAPGGQAGERQAHHVAFAVEHRADVGRHVFELSGQLLGGADGSARHQR